MVSATSKLPFGGWTDSSSVFILQRSSPDDDAICGRKPGIKMQDLYLLNGLRTDQVDVVNSLKGCQNPPKP